MADQYSQDDAPLDIFGSDPLGRNYLYGLRGNGDGQGLAPYGTRYAENLSQPTTAKRGGYFGNIGTINDPMTEFSSAFEVGGRTVQYPLVVPTLTVDELQLLRSTGQATPEINQKAQQFALNRLSRGQDPFATTQELRYPLPQGLNPAPITGEIRETPRSFISGLFSDVLGGALNMPNLQMTGVPALDLFYANRKPLMNLLGVGDVQKTAERISYGEPLTSGAGGLGGTSRPLPETVGAALTVAPFVGEATAFGARAGRAGLRMMGERMAENVAMGRPNLPSMFAEPRASLFAVEPSPMIPKPQVPVSELGFYSATEQAALNLSRNKGTGQSFLNDLMKAPDVKKDELAWTGLDDFLKNKPNVTKQEVQDFIANNKVDLQEVRLGGNEQPSQDLLNWMSARNISPPRNPEGWQELSQKLESYAQQHQKAQGAPEASQRYFTLSEEAGRISEGLDAGGSSSGATKYQKYQLAGGENYREILLKIPENMSEYNKYTESLRAKYGQGGFANLPLTDIERARLEKFYASEDIRPYQSSHFNDPNILAHIRVNDRIDADGKKMLLVEELQSDWHQAGREKGYKGQFKDLPNDYKIESKTDKDGYSYYEVLDPQGNVFAKDYSKGSVTNQAINRLNETIGGVPDAPFKDTWYQLALKRIMKYAADNGYERVGLTTGTQQADRYKLSNEVDEINVIGRIDARTGEKSRQVALDLKSGGSYKLGVNNEGIIDNVNMLEINNLQGKKLADVVGKDIAKKIMESNSQTIKGEGLNIGGEGMKAYYDEIYPKFLEKYGKKWDAGVGETKIITEDNAWNMAEQIKQRGISDAQWRALSEEDKLKLWNDIKQSVGRKQEPIRYIDITPKMKESVGKGQPLFTAIPAGTLGLGGLEYADPFASPLTEDTTR